MKRWLRFNAVGILGAGIQLALLALLLRLRVHYLVATAIAIEAAILHNYTWHCRWTWAGHTGSLWRFQASNGVVSLVSNLLLMRLFTGAMHLPPVPSNLAAIIITSFLNYALASKWVFAHLQQPGYDVKVPPGR